MVAFTIAFLPQFIDPAAGPVWVQFAILGAILIVLEFLVDGTVSCLRPPRAPSARGKVLPSPVAQLSGSSPKGLVKPDFTNPAAVVGPHDDVPIAPDSASPTGGTGASAYVVGIRTEASDSSGTSSPVQDAPSLLWFRSLSLR
jgi:hypothetical protein